MAGRDARRGRAGARLAIRTGLGIALALAGCSLDLDRLRAGTGDAGIAGSTDAATGDGGPGDGGPDDGGLGDGGAGDGGAGDAGPDAGVPPGCECGASGPWPRSTVTFSGVVTREVTAIDLDRDGDLDFVAAVEADLAGGSPVAVIQLPRACESQMLDLFPVALPMAATSADPVPYEYDLGRPLGLIAPDPPGNSLVVYEAEGSDASYHFSGTSSIMVPTPVRAVFAYGVTDASRTDLVLGLATPEFLFLPSGGLVTGAFAGGAPLELAALARVSDTTVWLFGGARGGSLLHTSRFVDGVPSLAPPAVPRPELALSAVTVGDIDGDGVDEALFLDSAEGVVHVRRVSGSMTLEMRDIRIEAGTSAIAVADLLGDGRAELVGTRPSAMSVEIYALGDGGDATMVESITLEKPTSILADDVDGDGRADLIVGHGYAGGAALTIMRQRCRP